MLEIAHDEVNRIICGDSERIWFKTFAVSGSDNANPVALVDEKYLINLAKFFLFVMLRSHAKAACNDNVRDAVDNQQCADVCNGSYMRRPGSDICS
jgi:hypothetical protein